jgi:hypothetical protein
MMPGYESRYQAGRKTTQMTTEELHALPVTFDLATAGRAFGIGKSTSYQLVRKGEFPCRVPRLGNTYRVTKAELFRALGLELDRGEHDGLQQVVDEAGERRGGPVDHAGRRSVLGECTGRDLPDGNLSVLRALLDDVAVVLGSHGFQIGEGGLPRVDRPAAAALKREQGGSRSSAPWPRGTRA